ncbi:MAG: hypothetical protein IPL61_03510 [Myxococcales bacterium]|nr:hypothetical protein [Myxococcales bacterium]
MKMRILAGAALVVAATAGLALAQPDYKAAAEHYKIAEQAMARGAFSDAALEYGIAYDITKDPILFFKIGQANDKAGKCPVALTYYNRYLKEGSPSEEYLQLTTERIAACTPGGAVQPDRPPPDTGPDTSPDTGPDGPPDDGAVLPPDDGGLGTGGPTGPSFIDQPTSWKRTGAWISTGLTVGLVAAGVVLAMSAEGSEEDLQALIDFRNAGRPIRYDEVRADYESLDDDGRRFDTLATAAFIGAGATAAVAVTLFLLDRGGPGAPESTTTLRPTLDRHGAGVAFGWEF